MTPLTALPPEAIHARRRPVIVLFVFFAELAWALLVATPVHAWARQGWGGHPDGDAMLFERGARDLLMWLGRDDAGGAVSMRTAMVLLAVGTVVMQLPLGAMLTSLAFSRGPASADADANADAKAKALTVVAALQVGVTAFLPLAALLALATVANVLVISLGLLASSAVDHGLAGSIGDARAFTFRVLTMAIFAVLVSVLGVFVDLARAAVGREAGLAAANRTSSSAWSMMIRGIKTAWKTSRPGLARATLAWAWRAALGLVLVAIAYYAAQALGGKGGGALVALFVIHQGVVLARVALRASWLAKALALVAPVQNAR